MKRHHRFPVPQRPHASRQGCQHRCVDRQRLGWPGAMGWLRSGGPWRGLVWFRRFSLLILRSASRLGVLARLFPPRSGTPAGVRVVRGVMGSGGVASLNHRLHSGIPPGCVRGAGPVCIAGRRKKVERRTSLAEEDDPVDQDATRISDIGDRWGIEGGVAQRRDGAAT